MASPPPKKPERTRPVKASVLEQYLGTPLDSEALARLANSGASFAALAERIYAAYPSLKSSETAGALAPEKEEQPAEIAGGGKGGRNKQGRGSIRGRSRVSEHLRFTEGEIRNIQKFEHRATREIAIATFCFGLFVDSAFILVAGYPSDKTVAGLIWAVAIFALGLTFWFAHQWRLLRNDGDDEVQRIINEHEPNEQPS